ncbi:SDR family oxidoreductase [Mycobacterium sp. PS03-16]|uniref:SDR family oxidoreductase n=1 Tax=Mycobacterium sp. PS03-16 TaxID=2559611 RepID=UPI0010748D95|nr:SDR family oxidoreductase [Mycobacterium sp. PS03-16]TFV58090.1 SDR family oxidoreductase [Mycobacterium sp. PS03-16]
MDVLVTGGDTDLGRVIAAGFRDDGHRVVITGARREDLEIAAKELDVDAIVVDNTDPAALEAVRGQLPHHLDTLVNVPAPQHPAGDPRTYGLADHATAWRRALEDTVLSAVLTVQIVGDHLRSGGSIVNVVPEPARDGSADAAVKAALADWTAGQAAYFGTRGITVNVVATGKSAQAGYDGLTGAPPAVADEFARLALFLSTPAARHITGQTLHVSRGALSAVR